LLNHEKDCLRNYNAGRKAKREAEKKEKSTKKINKKEGGKGSRSKKEAHSEN
jgi:hypothetical protein